MTDATAAWDHGWDNYFNVTLPQIFATPEPAPPEREPDYRDYTGKTVMLGLYFVDVLGYSPCRRNVHYKPLRERKRRRRGEGRQPRAEEWMPRELFEQAVVQVDADDR